MVIGEGKNISLHAITLNPHPHSDLLMHEVCVDLWPVFHEIVNPNIPVLSRETLAEDLGLKFQSVFKGRFCPF